jgi:hypothetical protein
VFTSWWIGRGPPSAQRALPVQYRGRVSTDTMFFRYRERSPANPFFNYVNGATHLDS